MRIASPYRLFSPRIAILLLRLNVMFIDQQRATLRVVAI